MTSKRKPSRPSFAKSASKTADTAVKTVRRNPWPSAALLAGIGAIGGFLLTRGRRAGVADLGSTTDEAAASNSATTGGESGSGTGAVPLPDRPTVSDTAPGPAVSPVAIAAAEGHPVPDLAGDERPAAGDRAVPHFRPDIDAPMDEADRAALAPPTVPLASA